MEFKSIVTKTKFKAIMNQRFCLTIAKKPSGYLAPVTGNTPPCLSATHPAAYARDIPVTSGLNNSCYNIF